MLTELTFLHWGLSGWGVYTLVGMSNPKDILFFSSFLSLLVPQNGSLLLHAQIVLVWVLVDLLIMFGYAWFARHQRLLDGRQLSKCCAVLLGAFGSAALLLETQPFYAHLSAFQPHPSQAARNTTPLVVGSIATRFERLRTMVCPP